MKEQCLCLKNHVQLQKHPEHTTVPEIIYFGGGKFHLICISSMKENLLLGK